MARFHVGDRVRIVDVNGVIEQAESDLNCVGVVIEGSGPLVRVRVREAGIDWWWNIDRLEPAGFTPGQIVLHEGQEYTVVGYDESGLVRLEDEDGELARPEDKLVAKGVQSCSV